MKTNKKQLLRNPDIQPSGDVIAKALGESNSAYIKFINELASHDIQRWQGVAGKGSFQVDRRSRRSK